MILEMDLKQKFQKERNNHLILSTNISNDDVIVMNKIFFLKQVNVNSISFYFFG